MSALAASRCSSAFLNRSLTVLREKVVGHDVVGHLQRGHQVHLKQAASLRTSSRKDVLHEDVGCAA